MGCDFSRGGGGGGEEVMKAAKMVNTSNRGGFTILKDADRQVGLSMSRQRAKNLHNRGTAVETYREKEEKSGGTDAELRGAGGGSDWYAGLPGV